MQRILEHVKPERRNKELIYNPTKPIFWERSFHFETIEQFISNFIPFIVPVLKFSGLYQKGRRNSVDFERIEFTVSDPVVPPEFDGFKVLFLSDLHIDGNDLLLEPFYDALDELKVDLCLLGGDYRSQMRGDFRRVIEGFGHFLPAIHSKEGVLGILGNHDSWEMIRHLERLGVTMLINESYEIRRGKAGIWVLGVDDPHYYKCDDFAKARQGVPEDAFQILLAHATGALLNLGDESTNLCLCGHTHAGQIRLPVLGPVITHSQLKGPFVYGHWQYNSIRGYTTSGVGTSGVHVRYNTRPELVVISLKSGSGDS
ncbi:MAG: metallophosphoesterase [bacterium]|nr:metallophosphoesterase [bacterium]